MTDSTVVLGPGAVVLRRQLGGCHQLRQALRSPLLHHEREPEVQMRFGKVWIKGDGPLGLGESLLGLLLF